MFTWHPKFKNYGFIQTSVPVHTVVICFYYKSDTCTCIAIPVYSNTCIAIPACIAIIFMYHKFVTFHKHNQGAEFQVSYNTQKSMDNTMATHAFG